MANEADYGLNIGGSLASYDRAASSWKTSQRCLDGELEEFSETWPRSGMMRNGNVYALPTSALRIGEREFGLWPTPRASEIAAGATMANVANVANPKGNLEEVVYARTFPTPTCDDASQVGRKKWTGRQYQSLTRKVTEIFPTPTASDAETHPNDDQRFDSLAAHIHLEQTGQLNPTWVEWLMGYPLGWTDLKV